MLEILMAAIQMSDAATLMRAFGGLPLFDPATLAWQASAGERQSMG
jgi:hypothetical protein